MLLTTQRNQRAKGILQRDSSLLFQETYELKGKRIKGTAGLPQAPRSGAVARSQRSTVCFKRHF